MYFAVFYLPTATEISPFNKVTSQYMGCSCGYWHSG